MLRLSLLPRKSDPIPFVAQYFWQVFFVFGKYFVSVQHSRLEFITLDRDLLANPQTAEIVTYSFGTLPRATLTLLQVMG